MKRSLAVEEDERECPYLHGEIWNIIIEIANSYAVTARVLFLDRNTYRYLVQESSLVKMIRCQAWLSAPSQRKVWAYCTLCNILIIVSFGHDCPVLKDLKIAYRIDEEENYDSQSYYNSDGDLLE